MQTQLHRIARLAPRCQLHRIARLAPRCASAFRNHSRSFSTPAATRPHESTPDQDISRNPDAKYLGMTGGQIFKEMMKEHDVECVFGYPGGAILPVYDAIYAAEGFQFILPRHEQGGGHMAEGYACVTGKPGICLVTSGPGATNMVTPMQDAMSDGTPMIVFSGQVPTTAVGSDAFQEADILGISRTCTKWNTQVKDIADLPRAIRSAFQIATSGRPGPVLVDLPKDVTSSTLMELTDSTPDLPFLRQRNFRQKKWQNDGTAANNNNTIEATIELLKKAERPVLYVGHGCMDSVEELKAFAEKANIPCTTTLLGMGIFDELSPLSLHMLGMHGSAYANFAMQNSDLIICMGARFDDRVTGALGKFAPEAKRASLEGRGGIVHYEILPKNINKVVQVDHYYQGNVKAALTKLGALAETKDRTPWLNQINTWKKDHPFRYIPSGPTERIKPQAVVEELYKQTCHRDDVIISTGVGQHQMWAAQYYRWRHPRSMVTSAGLGTMGFGLPAAIGAKLGRPDHLVVDIDGDASFSMTGMELQTAAQYNIGVKVIIFNNDFQGMVKQWQDLFYEKRYSGTVMNNPDWVLFAESMRCQGLRASTTEELPAKMAEFLADPRPGILEVLVDTEEHVYPMVPAGKGLDEMVLN